MEQTFKRYIYKTYQLREGERERGREGERERGREGERERGREGDSTCIYKGRPRVKLV